LRRSRDADVSIRVHDDPAELEVPFNWVAGMRVYWFGLRRGSAVLEIDMPARPNPAYLLWRIGVSAVIALAAWGLLAAARPNAPSAYILYSFLVAVITYTVIWFASLQPFAQREVLEVDSALVALRRDDSYIGVWGRRSIEDVSTADAERPHRVSGQSMLGGPPSIIWELHSTSSMKPLGGAGAGVNRDDAERIIASISEFCAQHPADPDAPKWEGRMPVRGGSWHRKRLAQQAFRAERQELE